MKRLGSLGAVFPFLALAALGCGANVDTGANPAYKFTMVADFETGSSAFNDNTIWKGSFLKDQDKSVLPPGVQPMVFESYTLPTPREIDGRMTSMAYHVADFGGHTYWGTVVYGDLFPVGVPATPRKPVDLAQFKGISLWARSAGLPGFTVKIGIADLGSFDFGQTGLLPDPMSQPDQLCNNLDTTVGGTGCYDDYAAKIYPDGVWRRYDIPFSSLATGGWGLPHAFDQHRVYRIKISMLPATAYDLYFDDIAFYQDP
jgi:hypothetical protein